MDIDVNWKMYHVGERPFNDGTKAIIWSAGYDLNTMHIFDLAVIDKEDVLEIIFTLPELSNGAQHDRN